MRVARDGASCTLAPHARAKVMAGQGAVQRAVEVGDAVYGVNTGFGDLAGIRIADDRLSQLQRRLILSHASGLGEPLDDEAVRGMLLLRANTLSPRPFRRTGAGRRGADRPARCRGAAARAEPGIGRGERGPCAAGSSGPAPDRVRAGPDRRPDRSRRRGAAPRRARAARARTEGGARPHQRHAGDDLAARAVVPRCAPSRAGRRPRRRALHRSAPRHRHGLRPAAARVAGASWAACFRREPVVADARLRHPGIPPGGRRAGAGPVQRALRSPGPRGGARRARGRRGEGRGRDERGHRQPARLSGRRGRPGDPLRRQLPRPADGVRGRLPGHRARRACVDRRAADREADQHRVLRSAAVPRARRGPQLRLHDGPGDRGGAGGGEQGGMPPGLDRFDSHLGGTRRTTSRWGWARR